jgi:hypothetical protein
MAFRDRGITIKATAEAKAKTDTVVKPKITCDCESAAEHQETQKTQEDGSSK